MKNPTEATKLAEEITKDCELFIDAEEGSSYWREHQYLKGKIALSITKAREEGAQMLTDAIKKHLAEMKDAKRDPDYLEGVEAALDFAEQEQDRLNKD